MEKLRDLRYRLEDIIERPLDRYLSTKAVGDLLFALGTLIVLCLLAFMIGMIAINDVNRMYRTGTALILGSILIGLVSAWLWTIVFDLSIDRWLRDKYPCRCD